MRTTRIFQLSRGFFSKKYSNGHHDQIHQQIRTLSNDLSNRKVNKFSSTQAINKKDLTSNSMPFFIFSGKFFTNPNSVNSYIDNYKKAGELSYQEFKSWLKSPEADEGSNWLTYGDAYLEAF